MRSSKSSLSGIGRDERESFLDTLSPNALMSLPWLFEHWAIEGHQLPPDGDWATWIIMGGRGAGKTRAGAEWIRAQVEGGKPGDPGACSRVALVGETIDEAREVMIFGESGILACSPPDRRPEWQATRKRLVWPNGAVAQVFSASNPESLRGPQFDCAWCDELAKWRKGRDAWDMLQFALRLGSRPRMVVTTSPRPSDLLRDVLAEDGTVVTRAATAANRMHLAEGFVEAVTRKYAGTRLARQELEGELVEDVEGALWTWEIIERSRLLPPVAHQRIIVAVDPPVTSRKSSDECGIIVAGADLRGEPQDWRAEVIADWSLREATPNAWAERAVAAFHRFGADRIVAEANQGGEMVGTMIRSAGPMVPFRPLRATRGKSARAEPVAALYERGRIRHGEGLEALEAQMRAMTTHGFTGEKSPDRVDALVWAITELLIDPAAGRLKPRARSL